MLARLSLLGATRQARRRRWISSSEGFSVIARSASSSSSSNHSPPPSSSPSFPFAPRDDPVAIPKLLISNRGEIACRIIHTARRLGERRKRKRERERKACVGFASLSELTQQFRFFLSFFSSHPFPSLSLPSSPTNQPTNHRRPHRRRLLRRRRRGPARLPRRRGRAPGTPPALVLLPRRREDPGGGRRDGRDGRPPGLRLPLRVGAVCREDSRKRDHVGGPAARRDAVDGGQGAGEGADERGGGARGAWVPRRGPERRAVSFFFSLFFFFFFERERERF